MFEVANAVASIVKLENGIKLVISLDTSVDINSTVESTIELVGSRVNDDIISNDVIVTLVMSIITEDKNAVVVNDSTTIVSDPNILSDDGLLTVSKDVRGARVDNEAVVGLAVNMLVIDTVVTATCSVVTVVSPINDSKLLSVIKSTTLEE